MIAPDTSKPSRWFVFALSALMVPMFKSQYRSLTRLRMCFDSAGDVLIMRQALLKPLAA